MRRLLLTTLFVAAVGTIASWHLLVDGPGRLNGYFVGTDSGTALDPPAPPAALPEPAPSRKQDGGPDARHDYERLRLADPATGEIPPDIHAREAAFAARLPVRDRLVYFEEPETAARLATKGADPKKAVDWSYRGPYNIGGRTRALALDVSDPLSSTILAGGVSGGMWRSTDDGATWTLTTGSSQLHSVTTVAQDTRPGRTHVWYYGTGERNGNSANYFGGIYHGDGVFKSTDGGLSWNLLPATSTATPQEFDQQWDYVWRVAVDASETLLDEVYAAAYSGIFRSTDGGATWTLVLGDPNFSNYWYGYTDALVGSDGAVYASLALWGINGYEGGIFRSPDGITWTEISAPDLETHGRIVMALAPSDETILYALVADESRTGGPRFYKYQYLSGDGSGAGGDWTNRTSAINQLPGPSGTVALQTYGGYCQNVTVAPNDPNLVFLGGVHLYRSTDGFASSAQVDRIGGWTYTNHHADQHWMLFAPGSTDVAYTGSDGGVHKTTDVHAGAVVWQSLNNGYNTSQFYTVAIEEDLVGNDVVVGGMQDNGTWWTDQVNGSAPWLEVLDGDGAYCAVADLSGAIDRYYFSSQNGVIYYMGLDDFGVYQQWTRVDPLGGAGQYLFINPFILDPNDRNVMYVGSENGVWRNSDLTAIPLWSSAATDINWTQLTLWGSSNVSALAMTRAGARTLYYGTTSGLLYRVDNADTAPGGTVPMLLNDGAEMPSAYVTSIAIDPTDDQHLLIAFSNYGAVQSLWTSYDGGATWHDVEGNLAGADGPSVRAVAIVPFGDHEFWFAGTSTGLYSALDPAPGSTVWKQESPGLIGNVVVDQLATRPAEGLIVAGTHGKGVYSADFGAAAATDVPAPAGLLAQNAPNPFNPRTSIGFRLPVAGRATLDVFDLKGAHVRRLLDEDLSADRHTVTWNGTDDAGREVSAGTYLYRLRSGDWSEQKKMTLIK